MRLGVNFPRENALIMIQIMQYPIISKLQGWSIYSHSCIKGVNLLFLGQERAQQVQLPPACHIQTIPIHVLLAFDGAEQAVRPMGFFGFLEFVVLEGDAPGILEGFLRPRAELLVDQPQQISASLVAGQTRFDILQILDVHEAQQVRQLRLGVDFQPLAVDAQLVGAGVQIGQALCSQLAPSFDILNSQCNVGIAILIEVAELAEHQVRVLRVRVVLLQLVEGLEVCLEGVQVVDGGLVGGDEGEGGAAMSQQDVVGTGEAAGADEVDGSTQGPHSDTINIIQCPFLQNSSSRTD